MSTPAYRVPRELEDALDYLPRQGVDEYRRGQTVYDESRPSKGLYLVVQGRVKVSVAMEDGTRTVIGIYSNDDLFGECALIGGSMRGEWAMALETTMIMSWSNAEIEEHVQRQSRLGMALIQMLVARSLDLQDRLQSLALDKTPQRVALSLLRFAGRVGKAGADGSIQIPPLTHQLLSEYIGTSREIVTFQMNDLRQRGLVHYSRKGINVFVDALAEHIRRQAHQGEEGELTASESPSATS
jgi:CRP/FNR family transcriptional regulator